MSYSYTKQLRPSFFKRFFGKILFTCGALLLTFFLLSGAVEAATDPAQQEALLCLLPTMTPMPTSCTVTAEEAAEIAYQAAFAAELETVLAGHPMAEMADLIAQEDPVVAALIVGIGKKESNWGKRSPSKAGVDCFNYWGFKTSGTRGQALGHACFGSREEAVERIANRIRHYVAQGRTTPARMLVWKCGRTCDGHDPAGVTKWVSDVQIYYNKVLAVVPEEAAVAAEVALQ